MVVSMLVVAARRGWEEVTAKMRVAAPGEEDTDTAQAVTVLPVASLVVAGSKSCHQRRPRISTNYEDRKWRMSAPPRGST